MPEQTPAVHQQAKTKRPRVTGVGRLLILVYGILALAATGRSVFQIIDRFGEAPVAFTLSGLAAIVYIVATIALIAPGAIWYRIAWFTISFELAGVLVIGTLSLFAPETLGLTTIDPFGRTATVWSVYGMGYLFVPLVLPILGMVWLSKNKPVAVEPDETAGGGSIVIVFRTLDGVPADFGPSAVTIGKFDGVHAGHRAVISTLKLVAAEQGLAATVITFDRNPLEILDPAKCPPALTAIDQKLDLLAGTGVDATLLLTFDRATADLSPEAFVESILVDRLHARVVLVGADFRFGARGAGDVRMLEALGERFGFVVRLIDDVRPEGGRRVSSTWIRDLLAEGDVAHAARLLGHVPAVRGVVVHGAARGRELGFPTANLSPESDGLIPADGVYAGWLTDEGVRYPAAISVGNNPTFEGVPQKQVEAYVLDEDLDLYGHRVEIAFAERIRGMVAFSGVDPLIAQIAADVERARTILA